MKPTTVHTLRDLASECTDPVRAEQKMRGTMEQAIVKTESIIRTNLLKKLHGRRVGTHGCERMALVLIREGEARRHRDSARRDITVVSKLMTIKIRQAESEQRQESTKFHKSKREL